VSGTGTIHAEPVDLIRVAQSRDGDLAGYKTSPEEASVLLRRNIAVLQARGHGDDDIAAKLGACPKCLAPVKRAGRGGMTVTWLCEHGTRRGYPCPRCGRVFAFWRGRAEHLARSDARGFCRSVPGPVPKSRASVALRV
jgi:hypothetical protein